MSNIKDTDRVVTNFIRNLTRWAGAEARQTFLNRVKAGKSTSGGPEWSWKQFDALFTQDHPASLDKDVIIEIACAAFSEVLTSLNELGRSGHMLPQTTNQPYQEIPLANVSNAVV